MSLARWFATDAFRKIADSEIDRIGHFGAKDCQLGLVGRNDDRNDRDAFFLRLFFDIFLCLC